MGSQPAKVIEFSQFAASLRSAVHVIDPLWRCSAAGVCHDVGGGAVGAYGLAA
jgi:hypothetical protein